MADRRTAEVPHHVARPLVAAAVPEQLFDLVVKLGPVCKADPFVR